MTVKEVKLTLLIEKFSHSSGANWIVTSKPPAVRAPTVLEIVIFASVTGEEIPLTSIVRDLSGGWLRTTLLSDGEMARTSLYLQLMMVGKVSYSVHAGML